MSDETPTTPEDEPISDASQSDDHDHGHSHEGGHGHSHDDVFHPELGAEIDSDDLDPANRSLAEALSISFNVLRLVMVALIGWWVVVSGATSVEEGKVGVRLSFGRIVGEPGKQVLEPGGPYWGPPDPLGRFIEVPTRLQKVMIDKAFWFDLPPDVVASKTLDQSVYLTDPNGLTPGIDGSLLTGDHNIVHGQWVIEYKIEKSDAVNFVKNIGLLVVAVDETETGSKVRNPMYRADAFVRSAAEQVILSEVARVTVDDFVLGKIDQGRIRLGIQRVLDTNETGITVTQVLVEDFTAPMRTRLAFKAVSEAESQQVQLVEEAHTESAKILNEVAGSGFESLLAAIENYEAVRLLHGRGTAKEKAADDAISAMLTVEVVEGRVAEMMAEAVAYRSRAKEDIRAEAETFVTMLELYLKNPKIVMDRLWQDTFQAIMGSDIETFYMASDPNQTLYLDLNRDPRIQKIREMQRIEQQAEAMDN